MVGQNKTKWKIIFHPNDGGKNSFGLHVHKAEESSQNFEYKARFAIMVNSKEDLYQEFSYRPSASLKLGYGYGYSNFLSHDAFFKRFEDFVRNSFMTFRVDITLRAFNTEGHRYLYQSVQK